MARQTLSGVTNSRRTIEIQNIDEITKEHLVVFTAETAIRVKKKYQNKNMFPFSVNDYLTIVDRRHGHGKEYNVRPGGRIMYQNNEASMQEVLEWIRTKILKFSPVRSGYYKSRHKMLVDGKGGVQLSTWSSGKLPDRYRYDRKSRNTAVTFVNDTIYARRIERGGYTTNGNWIKPWSRKTPAGGVYKVVARAAKLRFGQTVRIDFKYTKLASAKQVRFEVRDTKKGTRKMGEMMTAEAMYPSIRVRPRTSTKGGITV